MGGPGGKWQWRLKNDPSNPRMRLTTVELGPRTRNATTSLCRQLVSINLTVHRKCWTRIHLSGNTRTLAPSVEPQLMVDDGLQTLPCMLTVVQPPASTCFQPLANMSI